MFKVYVSSFIALSAILQIFVFAVFHKVKLIYSYARFTYKVVNLIKFALKCSKIGCPICKS